VQQSFYPLCFGVFRLSLCFFHCRESLAGNFGAKKKSKKKKTKIAGTGQ